MGKAVDKLPDILDRIQREVHHRMVKRDGGRGLISTGFHMGLPELQLKKRAATQAEYSISYIMRGRGWFSDSLGKRYDFAPGSVVQRYPNRKYDVFRDDAFPHLEFFLILPKPLYEGFLATGLTVVQPSVFNAGIDVLFVNRLLDFVQRFRSSSSNEVRSILMETLPLVIEFYNRDRSLERDSKDKENIERACQLLGSDFGSKISLESIAHEIGLSYESFRKKFREHKEISPSQYRIHKKQERAMELLIEDRLSIKEIAHELGYENPANFSRLFQKATGYPPGSFRAEHRSRSERNL